MSTRTALVTGTAQGIGQAIAGELAAGGIRVVGLTSDLMRTERSPM